MTNVQLRDLLTHYPNDCQVVISTSVGSHQAYGVQWEPNTDTLEIYTLEDDEDLWNVDPHQ